MSQNETEMTTQHSMLVVWGLYAQAFGLILELLKVPIQQKTVNTARKARFWNSFWSS